MSQKLVPDIHSLSAALYVRIYEYTYNCIYIYIYIYYICVCVCLHVHIRDGCLDPNVLYIYIYM